MPSAPFNRLIPTLMLLFTAAVPLSAADRLFLFLGDTDMVSRDAHATVGGPEATPVTGIQGFTWRAPAAGFNPDSSWVPTVRAWEPYHGWQAPLPGGTEYVGINAGDPWTTVDQAAYRNYGADYRTAVTIRADRGQPIRVVKYAASFETNLITHWLSNPDWDAASWQSTVTAGVRYQAMKSWVDAALAGQDVLVAGVFLIHGQADDGLVSAQKYERALRSLISRLRSDYGSRLPIILAHYPTTGPAIRAAQATVAGDTSVGSIVLVNANGLARGTNGAYTAASGDYLGNEMAAAWLTMNPVPSAPTPTVTVNPRSGRVTISGSATPGATVRVMDGATVVGTGTADGSGSYTVTVNGLSAGSHTLTTSISTFGGDSGGTASAITVPAPSATKKVSNQTSCGLGSGFTLILLGLLGILGLTSRRDSW